MSSAPASSLILPSSQKLKGEENYAQWVRAIEAIADQFDLHKYYHPKAPAGPPRIDEFSINVVDKEEQQKLKTWKEWVAQEAKMRQAIEYNLHPGPMAVIATERTAKDMWAKLKSQYEGSGTVLEYSAIKDYVRQTVFDFPNLETFINHFQKSCEKLITLDLTDVRKWHPTMFVMAVKDQYPIWAERQRSNIRSNPGISLSTLIADLVDEARGDQGRTNSDLAMVGSTTGKGKGKGKSHNNSESRGNLHHCRCCGNPQARHTTEKCFEDPKNEDAKLSWEKRNKKKWVDFKSKKTLQNSKKGKNEYHIGGDSDDDKPSSFAGIVNTSAISSRANSFVLPVSLQSACVSSVDFLRWIVDTGADRHICRDKKLFDSFLQQESLPMIGTAMGPIRPLGIGTVTLHCKLSSGKTRNVRLTDVLYLPCCPMNLFSGRKLYAQGGYVGNQGSIFDSNNVEIATVDDKLFIIENPRVFAYPAALHQAKPTLPLWHRRLGHLGLKNVKLTEKVTKGIEYVTDTAANLNGEDKTILCEACELSRPLRDVRKDVTPRNLSPFDQISVDVVMIKPSGRILVDESWSKINYATIFTDAATRYRWGIFHKEKKNVFEAVQKFEALSRTQYNCTIKRWRLDGGKEYSPKQMGLMARSLGQIVELTTPYNPEQDGKSERSIGILGARTRAVIIDQKIPQFLWPEIMRTQIFIVNRVANSALNDETPYQALNRLTLGNNEIPDLSHLRVLGCKVYVQIPAEKRVLSHKLDARAEIGILVGYEGSHIFRVYIPSRHTVIRSSNVRFDEDGHITSPQSQSPANQEELKFFENRGESSSAHDNEVSEESNNTDIEWLTPFEELAHGYENPIEEGRTEDNPNQENLTEEVSPPSRNRKTYERVSRVTRSGRSIVPPQPSPDETIAFASFLAATSSTRDPRSVSEALNGPDSSDWRQAFRKEYDSLRDKKTWTYLERSDVPKDKKVLSGKVVMKTKRDKEGAILKRKIRWVVRGFEQLYGRDYTQTYAGVCRSVSWKIAIAMAAMFDLEIDQMDAVTAFLNSKTDDDIYVELPPLWKESDSEELDDPVCKLLKALYGLKQAPRLWQNHLRLKLSEVGLEPLKSDNCIFRQKDSGIIVVTYIDDFLIIGKDRSKIDKLKESLRKKFDLEDLGAANYFLGVRIIRDRPLKRIYLCQDAYIKQILQRFSLENHGTVDCPSAPGSDVHMVKYEGTASAFEISEYQSKIGSLLYLAVHTRPEIAYQCSALSRLLTNPSPQHMKAANRVFHYLAGTINLCIVYDGTLGVRQSKLHSFTDSDWGGCRISRISTGGSVFFLAGGIVSGSTKRQSSVSLSSTEAEYYALSACVQELLWIQQIMGQMQYKGNDIVKTRVYCDNQSSISLSENPELHHRTKHIDIKHHFIRSHVAKGSVDLKYISTKEMAADGLTKPLSAVAHKEFVTMLHMEEYDIQG